MAVAKGKQEEKKKEEEAPAQDQADEKKYSADEVRKLIQEELKSGESSAIKELAKEVKELKEGDPREKDYVEEENIDPEDQLDEPHTFFCYKSGYFIVDDRRKGLPVQTPFGNTIRFQYNSSKRRTGFRGEEQRLHIATYSTYSAKERDWLKNHSLFGVMFFDKLDKASDEFARKSALVATYFEHYQNANQQELISYCNSLGVDPVDDLKVMRIRLAEARADQDMRTTSEHTYHRLNESEKERMITEGA
jgi:hypothetical protein